MEKLTGAIGRCERPGRNCDLSRRSMVHATAPTIQRHRWRREEKPAFPRKRFRRHRAWGRGRLQGNSCVPGRRQTTPEARHYIQAHHRKCRPCLKSGNSTVRNGHAEGLRPSSAPIAPAESFCAAADANVSLVNVVKEVERDEVVLSLPRSGSAGRR